MLELKEPFETFDWESGESEEDLPGSVVWLFDFFLEVLDGNFFARFIVAGLFLVLLIIAFLVIR